MDRYSVSRTKRSLFYIIMAFLTIGLIIAECVLPSERSQIASDENIIYNGVGNSLSALSEVARFKDE